MTKMYMFVGYICLPSLASMKITNNEHFTSIMVVYTGWRYKLRPNSLIVDKNEHIYTEVSIVYILN